MSEGKHTPTPWRLRTEGNLGSAIEAPSGKRYSELDDGYRIVCSYQECCASDQYLVQEENRRANGEFIVRAVNSHHALVDVLSRWLAYAEEELSEFDLEECESENLCDRCQSAGCINLRIRETRAALSSAAPPVEAKSEVGG
ncbi:MAG: hypothetical protein E6R08_09160 [Nevskiaceae bacterium]|nr:MAG: hypothetical protein E6R08_09160 [Nevskiaceae bacterium]